MKYVGVAFLMAATLNAGMGIGMWNEITRDSRHGCIILTAALVFCAGGFFYGAGLRIWMGWI